MAFSPGSLAVSSGMPRRLFALDRLRGEVRAAELGNTLPEPRDWVLVAAQADCPLLVGSEVRFSTFLGSDEAGAYAVDRNLLFSTQVRYYFLYNGRWQLDRRVVDLSGNNAGFLEFNQGQTRRDPISLRSSRPGEVFLVQEGRGRGSGERTRIGSVGPTDIGLRLSFSLDRGMIWGSRYRLELGVNELASHWLWPVDTYGVPHAFGAAHVSPLICQPDRCRAGTGRYGVGASYSMAGQEGPVMAQIVWWYAIRPDGAPLPIEQLAGELAILRADVVCAKSVVWPSAEVRSRDALCPLALPLHLGPHWVGSIVLGQMIVVGPGGSDVAISNVVGSALLPRGGESRLDTRSYQAALSWWRAYGVTGDTRFTVDLADRIRRLSSR